MAAGAKGEVKGEVGRVVVWVAATAAEGWVEVDWVAAVTAEEETAEVGMAVEAKEVG